MASLQVVVFAQDKVCGTILFYLAGSGLEATTEALEGILDGARQTIFDLHWSLQVRRHLWVGPSSGRNCHRRTASATYAQESSASRSRASASLGHFCSSQARLRDATLKLRYDNHHVYHQGSRKILQS